MGRSHPSLSPLLTSGRDAGIHRVCPPCRSRRVLLPCTPTRTNRHTHTHIHTQRSTRTCVTHSGKRTNQTDRHKHTHTTHAHTHTHTHRTDKHRGSLLERQTDIPSQRAHAHTPAHTHAHTHIPSPPPVRECDVTHPARHPPPPSLHQEMDHTHQSLSDPHTTPAHLIPPFATLLKQPAPADWGSGVVEMIIC